MNFPVLHLFVITIILLFNRLGEREAAKEDEEISEIEMGRTGETVATGNSSRSDTSIKKTEKVPKSVVAVRRKLKLLNETFMEHYNKGKCHSKIFIRKKV